MKTAPDHRIVPVVGSSFFVCGSASLALLPNLVAGCPLNNVCRLHTITTVNGGSKSLAGGDRIQATMVFEKIL